MSSEECFTESINDNSDDDADLYSDEQSFSEREEEDSSDSDVEVKKFMLSTGDTSDSEIDSDMSDEEAILESMFGVKSKKKKETKTKAVSKRKTAKKPVAVNNTVKQNILKQKAAASKTTTNESTMVPQKKKVFKIVEKEF